jgi:hypothetical protein
VKKLLLPLFLLISVPAFGQTSRPTETEETEVENKETEAETEEKYIVLRAGLDMTTHYFARGNLRENQRVIGQPWVEAQLHLWKDKGAWLSDVYGFARSWNSFHTGPTGGQSLTAESPRGWYESEFSAGLALEFFSTVTISGGWAINLSPNDSFETIEEAFLRGSVSDKHLWDWQGEHWEFDGFRLFGGFAWETNGQRDEGFNKGVYAEIGIQPGVTLKGWSTFPDWTLKVSIPVKVGFNLFEYYEVPNEGDNAFGYSDVGIDVELPLPCVPGRWGNWSLYIAGHWLHLDNNLAQFNGGENNELIGSGGVRFSY